MTGTNKQGQISELDAFVGEWAMTASSAPAPAEPARPAPYSNGSMGSGFWPSVGRSSILRPPMASPSSASPTPECAKSPHDEDEPFCSCSASLANSSGPPGGRSARDRPALGGA